MSSKIYKRRNFIINPSFQYRLIGVFTAVSIAMSLIIVSFSWHSYSSFVKNLSEQETKMGLYTDLVNEFIEPGASVFWVPKEVKKQVIIKLSIFTAVISLCVLLLGILISHRIAGPLHRLNNCLLAVSRDEPVPVLRFRDHDEFAHLADSFNKCVFRLKSKYEVLQKSEETLFQDLESYIENINQEDLKNQIKEKINQYKYGLNS